MSTDASADERRVLDRLDAEAIAELTADLVRAPSENPGGTEQEAVARLSKALEGVGASVELDEVHPGRPNLVAHVGPDVDGGLLFLGHSDVVPAGAGWTGDPFEPRRDGDHLVGRGTTDMKGGLAAVVAAMGAVHAEDPTIPLTLVCTVDEEADATGVLHHVATTPPRRYAACVVAEPTGLVTITGCRGATNLRIEVVGASAHAGRPDEGASAVLGAADVIALVRADHERLAGSAHPTLGAATWNVGTIAGGHGTSIVPDRCTLTLDRRTLPDEDPHTILSTLLDRVRDEGPARDARVRFDGVVEMVMPGFSTDEDDPVVRTVCDAVTAAGGPGSTGTWTAACEGGFIADHHGVPTLVLGPGDLAGQAHQPDERVAVGDLLVAARAYALIALRTSQQSPAPSTRSNA